MHLARIQKMQVWALLSATLFLVLDCFQENLSLFIHHYCFAREVLIITDHKSLVAIFKTDVATLSQHIQCILLKIHQYRVQIMYKRGPEIFIVDSLSWCSHKEGKDKLTSRYEYKNRHHTKHDRHPGRYLHFTDSMHISTGWTPSTSKKTL